MRKVCQVGQYRWTTVWWRSATYNNPPQQIWWRTTTGSWLSATTQPPQNQQNYTRVDEDPFANSKGPIEVSEDDLPF